MRRREFLVGLCGGAAWAGPSRAQQEAPLVGFLSSRSPAESALLLAEFHRGLAEAGYAVGRNVRIEHRWAEGRNDRLSAFAGELRDRGAVVLAAAGGNVAALAAKGATSSIPIVFVVGGDPVELGLVASLGRPGGNATGVSLLITELWAKRLEVVKELVPQARKVAVLMNPTYPTSAAEAQEVAAHAPSLGFEVRIAQASDDRQVEHAFASLAGDATRALLVANDPYFTATRQRLVDLAAKHRLPAVYVTREFVDAGGLVSYGANIGVGYQAAGAYVGRILKGAKASDLPVLQPTKIELLINLTTAKKLGLALPTTLLARADEVIE